MRRAFLSSVIQVETTRAFEIVYADSTQKVVKRYNVAQVTDGAIVDAVRSELAQFDIADAKPTALTYLVGDEIIPPSDPIPPDPTAAETAAAQFVSDYRLYQKYQRAVSMGFIDAADKRIAVLAATLKAEWLDAYLDFL